MKRLPSWINPLGAGVWSIIPLAAGLGLSSIIPLDAGIAVGAELAPTGVVQAAMTIAAVTDVPSANATRLRSPTSDGEPGSNRPFPSNT